MGVGLGFAIAGKRFIRNLLLPMMIFVGKNVYEGVFDCSKNVLSRQTRSSH